MGAEVLEFTKKEQHLSGEAICKACKHEWVAVAPVGTIELECPECGTEKGLYKYGTMKADSEYWICGCGCDVFRMCDEEIVCYVCGQFQVIPF